MMRQLHSWGRGGDLSVCDPPLVSLFLANKQQYSGSKNWGESSV